MPGRVAGKGIVITGAGSGMGRAFALGLAREGASIGVLDVNHDAAMTVGGRDQRRRSRVGHRLVGRREQTRGGCAGVGHVHRPLRRPRCLVQQRRVQPADAPDRRHRGELAFDHGRQRARLPHRHPRRREADDPAATGQDRKHVVHRRAAGVSEFRAVLCEQVRGERPDPSGRACVRRTQHHLQCVRARRGRHALMDAARRGSPGHR